MFIFFKEYIFVLLITLLYGLIGGFTILPFRNYIKYSIMVAPMAGMLLSALGVFLLYSFAKLSVSTAIILIGIMGSTITLLSCIIVKPSFNRANIKLMILLLLIFGGLTTFLMNYATIQYQDFGILYFDGSDHMGYAAMADWLNNHLVTDPPRADPSLAYQSFPAALLEMDERFGAFFTLAIIATLFGKSSTFSYDVACSIILLINYLGIAALFSRSNKILILLILTFMTSFWFILAQAGYFGKIIGFGSIIFILGLYLISSYDTHVKPSRLTLTITIVLAFAAAMTYPGRIMSFFLITAGGLFLITKHLNILTHFKKEKLAIFAEDSIFLFILILIGFAANGLLKKPSLFEVDRPFPLTWFMTILNQLEIRYLAHDNVFSWYSSHVSNLFLNIAILIMITASGFALLKKNIIAASLINTALFLLIVPYFIFSKWVSYELTGTLYPLFACGLAWLIDDTILNHRQNKIIITFLFYLFILTISIRVPSFIESIHRFVFFGFPYTQQYSEKEMNLLAQSIDNHSVIVDVPNVMFALPILVEFGRQGKNLQWTPQSWKQILGYRAWSPPPIHPTQFVLGLSPDVLNLLGLIPAKLEHCDIIAKTKQYRLFSCQNKIETAEKPLTYIEKKLA